ncbi:hypothetical protein MNL08_07200 [Bartonella krasnovii]|uniref:hypothetical protein n=1 Tax=Bartonella krasnovii TaxID=2267275 RepID=UPI001F4CA85B|nr:hypothetical protein [Bartonella krasnovii]UNF41943.1 hypothetical protein MNL08_07200 [Bartonella krasnovii]UNF55149.1 hypothetical protein MNL00_07215 [Bartonella krasnovii]
MPFSLLVIFLIKRTFLWLTLQLHVFTILQIYIKRQGRGFALSSRFCDGGGAVVRGWCRGVRLVCGAGVGAWCGVGAVV